LYVRLVNPFKPSSPFPNNHSNRKQLDRGYAVREGAGTFRPAPLGEALISAYRRMGLDSLWMPGLRGAIERNITAIARGERSKAEVLAEAAAVFAADFATAQVGYPGGVRALLSTDISAELRV
jgi:nitroreductase